MNDRKIGWQVQSDQGLEGIYDNKDEADRYAQELRGIGALGLKVSECTLTKLPTRYKLARALESAGFNDLAARARADEFDDYRSPHATPQIRLVEELRAARAVPCDPAVEAFVKRVIAGEFDGTKEEAEQWAGIAIREDPELAKLAAEIRRNQRRGDQ